MNPPDLEMHLIKSAVESRATDIHIEPREIEWIVRFRMNGNLIHYLTLQSTEGRSLVQRIKVQANMDLGETRRPQDGSYVLSVLENLYDIRVSSLPTIGGEKLVLRILYKDFAYADLRTLGLKEKDYNELTTWLEEPMGLILFTGPTGAGKTTTMYAVIHYLNKDHVNICSIEDPIEVRLKGINQVQVNEAYGLTFSNGLKSILRQDPDIIVIGEIRDKETAEIAIRASISGHLVLATLHSNDASSAITRLLEMGIEPYLVTSALKGIVFQQMIHIPCIYCQQELYCSFCGGKGVMQKAPHFELMKVMEELNEYILNKRPPSEIRSFMKEISKQISIPL